MAASKYNPPERKSSIFNDGSVSKETSDDDVDKKAYEKEKRLLKKEEKD